MQIIFNLFQQVPSPPSSHRAQSQRVCGSHVLSANASSGVARKSSMAWQDIRIQTRLFPSSDSSCSAARRSLVLFANWQRHAILKKEETTSRQSPVEGFLQENYK